jgi:ADP-dependent NAD(P)H-hydrate dehydratase / NAD(P)H-hydrate epimerase
MKLVTAHDMKKIDEMAVKEYSLSIGSLMERAGRAVVREMSQKWAGLSRKKVGVLCGKGHNGGDGLVIARLLKQKKIKVVAVVVGESEDLAPETRKQHQKAKSAKVPLLTALHKNDLKSIQIALEECDLLVDSLLGTGLSRPVEGIYRDLIQMAKSLGKPVTAVDIPSGLSADSGCPLGEVLPADLTVTFGLPKTGFYTSAGSALAGEVKVDAIDFPEKLLEASFVKQEVSDLKLVQKALPRYDENTHKGTRGRLLVVAGATGLTGAAALCALGAQRIGTGLVTVACPESLNSILEIKLTEPMTAPVPEVEGGFLSLRASGRILHLATNVNAVVIGPGIGRHRETGQLIRDLLTKLTVPMVVDADALYLLGGQLNIFKEAKASVILTPHPGEAAWLLKTTITEVEQNRVKVAKQIAEGYNVTAVLKGRFTVIANPQGEVRINPTGNRGLATAGTGDVLSGIVGGLLAQRLSPFDAATAGVYLHGLAGEKASRKLGPDGLLAGDLLPLLPRLLRWTRETHREPLWPSQLNSKTNGKRFLKSSRSGNRASTNT